MCLPGMTDERRTLPETVETARILLGDGQTEWRSRTFTKTGYLGPPEGMELALNSDTISLSVGQDDEEHAFHLPQAILAYSHSRNENWIPIIQRLVGMGADIHAGLSPNETALDALFRYSRDPCDSGDLADVWLAVLGRTGVDLQSYLRSEMRLHGDEPQLKRTMSGYYIGCIQDRRLEFSLGDTPHIRWEWWTEPSSPALLLINEFRGLISFSHPIDTCPTEDSFPDDWPFEYSYQQRCGVLMFWATNEQYYKERAQLAEARFERRMRRKMANGFEAFDETDISMPGGWVE